MLGMAELSGHEAHRPRDDEHPADAIDRVRPAVVLLDCEHPVARADEFYRRARKAGTRVLFFNAMHTPREAELIAARRGARAVTLPLRPREFDAELRQTLAS
jgi:DNA-binding response OmpR family regulator